MTETLDLRTPEEKAFIEHLDAVCEAMGEELARQHWDRGEPLIIERDGVTMLKYEDGRVVPLSEAEKNGSFPPT